MEECPFCDYDKPDKSVRVITANEHAFSVVNKVPFRKGHCTVIIKRHIISVSELTTEEFHSIGDLISKMSRAMEKYYKAEKTYILSIGDKVNHFHIHLIPKFKGQKSMGVYCFENLLEAEGEITLSDEELKKMVNDIKSHLLF